MVLAQLGPLTIAGLPGRRWISQGPYGDVLHAAVGKGDTVYLVSGYPAATNHEAAFDGIVQSLRLP